MTPLPLVLQYSAKFPFPMNSKTKYNVSSFIIPINATRLLCRTDLKNMNEIPRDKLKDLGLVSACRQLSPLTAHLVHGKDSDQTGWMPRLI